MDELVGAFAVSQITVQQNSTAAEHPHFALYKAKRTSVSQEERRRKFLEAQKLKRYDYASHARGLATSTWDYNDGDDEENEAVDMELDECVRPPPRSYKNQLMLSEWLVEVPCDIETQWLFVFCPVGKRCLVVSSRGITKVYTKNGYQVNCFQSLLPGGNHIMHDSVAHAYCLLDCVYSEIEKTYYILDIMCWNSHPCFDSDTEFRSYWLHTKIDECPKVKSILKCNPYKFLPLPYYKCDVDSLKEALWSPLPFPSKLDGILFYHKKTHYTSGTTPLVGWLKAYMIPEMLHIEVPSSLCTDKPSTYISMQQHVPEAFQKHEARKKEEEKNMQYEDD